MRNDKVLKICSPATCGILMRQFVVGKCSKFYIFCNNCRLVIPSPIFIWEVSPVCYIRCSMFCDYVMVRFSVRYESFKQ